MTRFLIFFEAILSIFGWAAIGIVTVAVTALILGAFLLHPFVDPDRRIAHAFSRLWGRCLVRLTPGTRVRIFGQERIPKGQAVVFMANHQSYTDIPILCFLDREFRWAADIDLFKIPVLGWAMGMAGDVPIDRKNPRQAREALEKAKVLFSKGISLFLFPEGTRSHTGVFGRFQPGGFRLAAMAGVPIVPIVLVGTRQFLPRGAWIFRFGVKPQLHILPPVLPISSGMKEIYRLSRELRSQMMAVYRQHLKDFS